MLPTNFFYKVGQKVNYDVTSEFKLGRKEGGEPGRKLVVPISRYIIFAGLSRLYFDLIYIFQISDTLTSQWNLITINISLYYLCNVHISLNDSSILFICAFKGPDHLPTSKLFVG